jgi:hypothetical protein
LRYKSYLLDPVLRFEREKDGVVSFNYHPLAMGVGFIILMPEALLVYADLEDRKVGRCKLTPG